MSDFFNPTGGQEASEVQQMDYNAVFTGVVDATPVCFNPTKSQLIQYKEIPEEVQGKINEPVYKVNYGDGEKSQITLLCKINPNELLGLEKDKYNNPHFFNITITCSSDIEKSQSGNFRFINERNQSTWAASLETIKANDKMDWFDTTTARKAKVGEVSLYNLLYALYSKVDTKESPLKSFKLGDNPSDTFDMIVAGDVSFLNGMIHPDGSSYSLFSHENGEVRKVACLLGAKTKDDRTYQRVFTNDYIPCFFKEGRSISKKVKEAVEEGRFKAVVGQTYEFKPFDPSMLVSSAENDAPSEVITEISDGLDDNFDVLDDDALV